jgi:hypothetical protein
MTWAVTLSESNVLDGPAAIERCSMNYHGRGSPHDSS